MPRKALPQLSERIKALREAKGWSQDRLAGQAKVSRPAVSQWESGNTKNIKNETLVLLARAFQMTVDELLTGNALRIMEEPAEYGAGAVNREEEVLLEKYRHLSPADRTRLQAIVNALDATDVKKGTKES